MQEKSKGFISLICKLSAGKHKDSVLIWMPLVVPNGRSICIENVLKRSPLEDMTDPARGGNHLGLYFPDYVQFANRKTTTRICLIGNVLCLPECKLSRDTSHKGLHCQGPQGVNPAGAV